MYLNFSCAIKKGVVCQLKNLFSSVIKNSKRLVSVLLASSFLFGASSLSVFAGDPDLDPYVENLITSMNNDFRKMEQNRKIRFMMTCIFMNAYNCEDKNFDFYINEHQSIEPVCFIEGTNIKITMHEALAKSQEALDNLMIHHQTQKGGILCPDEKAEYYLLKACFYIGIGYYLYTARELKLSNDYFDFCDPNAIQFFTANYLYNRGMKSFFDNSYVELYDFYNIPVVIYTELYNLVGLLRTNL